MFWRPHLFVEEICNYLVFGSIDSTIVVICLPGKTMTWKLLGFRLVTLMPSDCMAMSCPSMGSNIATLYVCSFREAVAVP